MSKINDGGPAFAHGNHEQGGHSGMSLRDWFAGQALTGILSGGFADTIPHDDISGGGEAAFFAYQYADAMLLARSLPEEDNG